VVVSVISSWPNLSGNHYAMGSGFSILNRKYGQSLFGKIETDCKDGGAQTSYQCLDALIKAAVVMALVMILLGWGFPCSVIRRVLYCRRIWFSDAYRGRWRFCSN
jgi:hypothetical protein